MTDADVVVVGAGPTGLMLAGELRLAGVRPLVLERRAHVRETPKANGIGGQILRLLHYRGLLPRLEAATTAPTPAPVFPFGGLHVDLTRLADSPMHALPLPQPRLEQVLEEHAREAGADVRRGHEVTGVRQDGEAVTADVRGPDGPYRVAARYLVGCDGGRGRVRELAGIPFPGVTYPEVNRLGQVAWPDAVTRHGNGDLEVPGAGRIAAGFTRTGGGVFAHGSPVPGVLFVFTSEDESTEYDDDVPMPLSELAASVRRVLGADVPMGDPIRLSRFTFQARQAERYRAGRILLAGDAAHLFPATGVALNAGMLDTVNLAWKLGAEIQGWAPAGLLDTYEEERRVAADRTMLHTQAQVALRRGLDPAADALRSLFEELLTDEEPLRRMGSLIAGADIRYPALPDAHPLTGTFAADLAADSLRTARPVLLDLAGRPDLRAAARDWDGRVDIRTAKADDRTADALLLRPDAHIAWAARGGEPRGTATSTLRQALSTWFGTP